MTFYQIMTTTIDHLMVCIQDSIINLRRVTPKILHGRIIKLIFSEFCPREHLRSEHIMTFV